MFFNLFGIQLEGTRQVGHTRDNDTGRGSRRLFDLIESQIVRVTQTPTGQTIDVVLIKCGDS